MKERACPRTHFKPVSGTKRTYSHLKSTSPHEPITAQNECDSHTDTCCTGKNWSVIEFTDVECNVTGFSNDLGSLNKIPIATVGTFWLNPADSRHYILVICKALFFGEYLDHSLINPNQI